MSYNDYVKLCEKYGKIAQSSNSHWIIEAEALYTYDILINTKLNKVIQE